MRLNATTIGWIVGMLIMLGLLTLAATKPASAQQPPTDSVDILYNRETCRVSIDWEDGQTDTEVLQVSVGAIFLPDVPVLDFVGDQSQVLSSFTLQPSANLQRVEASIFDGGLIDREVRFLACDPQPVQQTAPPQPTVTLPLPTPTPIVVVQQAAAQREVLWRCDDGRIVRIDVAGPGCSTQVHCDGDFAICRELFTRTQAPSAYQAPVVQQAPIAYQAPVAYQAPSAQQAYVAPSVQSAGTIKAPNAGDGGLLH